MAWIAIAVARWRGAAVTLPRNILIGAIVIGLLCIAVFIAGGHPWSVTFGFTLWGAKIASALGFNIDDVQIQSLKWGDKAINDGYPEVAINVIEGGMHFKATIHKLDMETRELLSSTFETVNGHFGRMFPSLFGGGQAKLIMTGDEDESCLEPALYMKRMIRTSALVVIPKSGHTINLEEPEFFNRCVLDFVTAVDAGRSTPRNPASLSRSAILLETETKS